MEVVVADLEMLHSRVPRVTTKTTKGFGGDRL